MPVCRVARDHDGMDRATVRRLGLAVALVAVLVAGVVRAVASGSGSHHSRRATAAQPIAPCPTTSASSGLGLTLPINRGAGGVTLVAMSATGPSDVWVLGTRSVARSSRNTVVLHFNGETWTTMNVPGIYEPTSIAAAAPRDVWVVGGARRILHWNGAEWSYVMLPRARGAQLSAVSASAPNDVWVVGDRYGARLPANSVGSHTLAYHYDGKRWSIIATPNLDYRYNDLTAVVSVSPTYTIVAASAGQDGYTLFWDGTAWHQAPLPAPEHHLHVSIEGLGMAGTEPWAVGHTGGPGYGNPIYLKWTGAIWQPVPMKSIDYNTPTPGRVSGDDSFDVWATGYWNSGGFVLTHYTGHDFYYHHLPLPAEVDASLSDIKVFSPTNVWAVGGATDRRGSTRCHQVVRGVALIEHWDGTTWTPARVPGLRTLAVK